VEGGKTVGILTKRDLRFQVGDEMPVRDVMTPAPGLVTAPLGTTLDQAKAILHKNKVEKLILTGPDGVSKGLITIKDIDLLGTRIRHAWKDGARQSSRRCGDRGHGSRARRETPRRGLRRDRRRHRPRTSEERGRARSRKSKRRFPGAEVVAGDVAT
jgi:IMP dehydrogenase